MSNLEEQLEVDIKRFLENIENQNHIDKLQSLRDMFDKYLHLNTCKYVMDYHDLHVIMSNSKANFVKNSAPTYLGKTKRQVSAAEYPSMCLVEATIQHLNNKDCLKKMPIFDKRDNKF